jgi:hypothetical protein
MLAVRSTTRIASVLLNALARVLGHAARGARFDAGAVEDVAAGCHRLIGRQGRRSDSSVFVGTGLGISFEV